MTIPHKHNINAFLANTPLKVQKVEPNMEH